MSDKVAGVTGEHVVIYITLTSFSESDHFADVRKMIINNHFCLFTSNFSFFNGWLEVTPLCVAKEFVQLSCTPTLYTVVVTHDTLKLLEEFFDFFCLHKTNICCS